MKPSPGGLEDRLSTLERQMREIMALLPRLARGAEPTTIATRTTAAPTGGTSKGK